LIVNTFHVLAVNSVQSLKNHFIEQLTATPSRAEIISYVEEIKRKVDKESANAEKDEQGPAAIADKPSTPVARTNPTPAVPAPRLPVEVIDRSVMFVSHLIRVGGRCCQTAYSIICH
jgi:hypothetical protein